MRLTIRHSTRYDYCGESRNAVQRLKLTPTANAAQAIVDWNIEAPGIDVAAAYTDGFGNVVHLLSHAEPHDSIEIVATGTIDTTETGGVYGRLDEMANPGLFRRSTERTRSSPAIDAMARDVEQAIGGHERITLLHGLLDAVHGHVAYDTTATDSETDAATAFAAGRGVCQDHAHIFIAAARALDVPARYVTGYLHVESDTTHAAHHAWAEAHVEDLGWVGFDPANGVCPTEAYVRLACGFDAPSAAPVTGTRRGGGGESLTVDVAVAQAQQQA